VEGSHHGPIGGDVDVVVGGGVAAAFGLDHLAMDVDLKK
jgi:hypothetical protein